MRWCSSCRLLDVIELKHFITTTTMPPPWLLLILILLSLLPYTSASVPLSALRTRAELGAVDSPLAAHRAFTELVKRERRVIGIYQDRAVRCHAISAGLVCRRAALPPAARPAQAVDAGDPRR